MYAYLVEATGIFEILGEVVRRYVVGETLADTVAGNPGVGAVHRGAVLSGSPPRSASVA